MIALPFCPDNDAPGEWEAYTDGDLSGLLDESCTGMEWRTLWPCLFAETIRDAPAEEADHMLRSTFGLGDWTGRFAAFIPSCHWATDAWENSISSEDTDLASVLWSGVVERGILILAEPNAAPMVRYCASQPECTVSRCKAGTDSDCAGVHPSYRLVTDEVANG